MEMIETNHFILELKKDEKVTAKKMEKTKKK